MATGQSDVCKDFDEEAVDKKKIKRFSNPKIFKKTKTISYGKHSTDISSSPPSHVSPTTQKKTNPSTKKVRIYIIILLSVCLSNSPATKTQKIIR